LKNLDGDRNKLVIDLSCRRVGEGWRVAMDKWQTITEFEITKGMFFFFDLNPFNF
jgi:phosphoribosylformimino-5-aminoimidazole carboxamide ribotide isomerase